MKKITISLIILILISFLAFNIFVKKENNQPDNNNCNADQSVSVCDINT